MALVLQAMCAGLDRLVHLVGHTWPQEVLPQQKQGKIMPLMSCISVAPIQSGNMMDLGTTKSKISSVSPWALSIGIRHPDKSENSVNSVGSVCLPHLEVCSARSTFKSVCSCAFSQSNTSLNNRTSLWASA